MGLSAFVMRKPFGLAEFFAAVQMPEGTFGRSSQACKTGGRK